MAFTGGTLGGQWSVDGFRDPARALFDSPFPLHPTKRDIGDAYQAITRWRINAISDSTFLGGPIFFWAGYTLSAADSQISSLTGVLWP